jgi:acetolactate synthase-1/2/3 large subunit
MKISFSKLIVKYMERLGIEYVFGIPGSHILPVYDSLYDSQIQCILAKHEQGAGFMAGGYARVSGKVAACVTTAGPGATNIVTAVANAYVDRLPLLVITGETPTYMFGKGGLQECSGEGGSIDQEALFKSITRYNKTIERTDYIAQVLNQTSKALTGSNPGPVHLCLPFNIQKDVLDETILDQLRPREVMPDVWHGFVPVEQIKELLEASQYPVVIAGHGALLSGSGEALSQLCHRFYIPFTTSIKGRGVIPETSALFLGSLGVTSEGIAYKYIAEKADLLLFLGASFNERTSYVWDSRLLENKKIIQVDIAAEQLGKVFQPDIAVQGDVKAVMTHILEALSPRKMRKPKDLAEWKKKAVTDSRSRFSDFREKFALVESFYKEMEKRFSDNIIIVDDNIVFAQNFYKVSGPNTYFSNSGIASIGHAVPAAIGSRCYQNKPTFAILGDGGFQMCCMELMAAVNYKLPVTAVVFNNSSMGLIRKNQAEYYGKRFICSDFINPDYELLAKSFNIEYAKIEDRDDIARTFKTLDFDNDCNLIEIMLDKDTFPDYNSKR